ncbi:RNA-directed DNA polymerase, eukaryota, reverse transcriptase zinc-binding domain protein [Tanacetum coccineum]
MVVENPMKEIIKLAAPVLEKHAGKSESGFSQPKHSYVSILNGRGLWLWLQFQNVDSCTAFKNNTNLKTLFTIIKSVSRNFYVDERMVWVEISGLQLCALGSNAFKKVVASVGKFMFFEDDRSTNINMGRVCIATKQLEFISEVVKVVIHAEVYDVHIDELGSWSINIIDSSSHNSEADSKVDVVFINEDESECEGDFHELYQEDKVERGAINPDIDSLMVLEFYWWIDEGIYESKMMRLEVFRIKSMWENYMFDYASSLSRGRSGGLISIWDPNVFVKIQIWCDDSYIIMQGKWAHSDEVFYMVNIYGPQETDAKSLLWSRILEFIGSHDGHYVIFGDMNEVRDESKQYEMIFSQAETQVYNNFIENAGLLDLPLGWRSFTWMNKEGTNMSKLDQVLVSSSVMDAFPNLNVITLPRG